MKLLVGFWLMLLLLLLLKKCLVKGGVVCWYISEGIVCSLGMVLVGLFSCIGSVFGGL